MKSLYDMITDELAQMRADDERSAILAHEMRKACRPHGWRMDTNE